MRTSAPELPDPGSPIDDEWLDPPVPVSTVEEPRRAGATTEDFVVPDAGPSTDTDTDPPSDTPEAHEPPPAPREEFPGKLVAERDDTWPAKPQRGGRHLAPRKRRDRTGWLRLAASCLMLASLVLLVASITGHLGPGRPAGDQAAPEQRRAQAGAPPAQEPASAPGQLIALDAVSGEGLGDTVTYADGVTGGVLATGQEAADGDLTQVWVRVKMTNQGRQPVDTSTARVELAFAGQSGRATLLTEEGVGTLQPAGEGTGKWTFRMPANQTGDITVTFAPTEQHQPVTFHGASS